MSTTKRYVSGSTGGVFDFPALDFWLRVYSEFIVFLGFGNLRLGSLVGYSRRVQGLRVNTCLRARKKA